MTLSKESSKLLDKVLFSKRKFKSTKNRFSKGDVLYGKLRPYLNKVIVAHDDGVCTTEILPLSSGDSLDNYFLFYWLKSPEFLTYVTKVGYGVNMPCLGTKDGVSAPFILVPFAEQKECVAAKTTRTRVHSPSNKVYKCDDAGSGVRI